MKTTLRKPTQKIGRRISFKNRLMTSVLTAGIALAPLGCGSVRFGDGGKPKFYPGLSEIIQKEKKIPKKTIKLTFGTGSLVRKGFISDLFSYDFSIFSKIQVLEVYPYGVKLKLIRDCKVANKLLNHEGPAELNFEVTIPFSEPKKVSCPCFSKISGVGFPESVYLLVEKSSEPDSFYIYRGEEIKSGDKNFHLKVYYIDE